MKLNGPEGPMPEFFTQDGVEKFPWFWEPFYSFPVTLFAIVVIPSLVAGIFGYLVFRNRIRGVYFSILTQAALLVFFNVFNGQQEWMNGTNGLKTDQDVFFGMVVNSPQAQITFYELTILFLLLTYALCRWLTTGRLGRVLIAIRDDETRVRFTGYNPTEFKTLVFALSGAIAGVAGALYMPQTGIITPNIMEVAFSIEMVIWVAVGGRGTLIGAIIGALVVNFAQTFLSEQFAEIWLFFQGALFLLVVTVLPDGLVGWFKTWLNSARSLLGLQEKLISYPNIEKDPEIQKERQEIEH
jgi:urea transport system permease protein